MSLTQSLLPVVALMAPSAVSATEGKGESSSEKRVGKCPNDSQGYYEAMAKTTYNKELTQKKLKSELKQKSIKS